MSTSQFENLNGMAISKKLKGLQPEQSDHKNLIGLFPEAFDTFKANVRNGTSESIYGTTFQFLILLAKF